MYVVVTFGYSFNLELALSELGKYGYAEDQVLAIPMQPFKRSSTITDMISEDSSTLFDLSLVLGTVGMLLGVIYGNVMVWGPILWGLIGLVAGGIIGLIISLLIHARRKRNWNNPTKRQVILLIRVQEQDRISELEQILKPYEPTGMATIDPKKEALVTIAETRAE